MRSQRVLADLLERRRMYGWVSMRAEDRLTKPVSRCRTKRNRLCQRSEHALLTIC
jgi:hypothetical protein